MDKTEYLGLWAKALEAYRRDPRGGSHQKKTFALLDVILKEKLVDAPILKYSPGAWADVLFRCYFSLRSHYWENLYRDMIQDPEERGFIDALFRWMPLKGSFYIRIVALLIRIIADRILDDRYDSLPALPGSLYFQPFFLTPGSMGSVTEDTFRFIDKITNGASSRTWQFFEEAIGTETSPKRSLAPLVLLPIPLIEFRRYGEFARNIREDLSKIFAGDDTETETNVKTTNGGLIPMTFITPAFLNAVRNSRFASDFLTRLATFLCDMYSAFVPEDRQQKAKNFLCLIKCILETYSGTTGEPVLSSHDILTKQLKNYSLDPTVLDEFIYPKANSSDTLVDPLNSPQLFQHSLELFRTPFISKGQGSIYFSTFWIFDAFVSRITAWLRDRAIPGKKRGSRAENYIAYMIDKEISTSFPDVPYSKPFKLIILNKDNPINPKGGHLKDLERIKQDCELPIIEIKVKPSQIGLKQFEYRELDFAFIFYDILLIVEVKDNLFWDLDDLPPSIYLWQQNELKKLQEKVKLLELPKIRTELAQHNIHYNAVRAKLVTQDHLITRDRTDYLNLVQELFDIRDQRTAGGLRTVILGKVTWLPFPIKK